MASSAARPILLCLAAVGLVACATPGPRGPAAAQPESSRTPEPTAPAGDAPPPAPLPSSTAPDPIDRPAAVVHLADGLEADRAAGEVRVAASVALTQGWLEQAACSVGTRDHESLLVTEIPPSAIHAALLLVGATPGRPGMWRYESDAVIVEPPAGAAVEVLVRWSDADGAAQERPIEEWIRGADGRSFPGTFVFAGSLLRPNPPSFGPGEHYVADYTGSIVGLVTFGDELIGAQAVIPDQVGIEAANWEAWTERMPPSGTTATLVLRPLAREAR